MMKEYDIQEVIIESSPFLRTMMTASLFLKNIKSDISTITMERNERLGEVLLPKLFKEDPRPLMISNKCEKR